MEKIGGKIKDEKERMKENKTSNVTLLSPEFVKET